MFVDPDRTSPIASPNGSPLFRSRRLSIEESESVLRAAASLLVLGPTASAGTMPMEEIRAGLMSAPPEALVKQLIGLLDEQVLCRSPGYSDEQPVGDAPHANFADSLCGSVTMPQSILEGGPTSLPQRDVRARARSSSHGGGRHPPAPGSPPLFTRPALDPAGGESPAFNARRSPTRRESAQSEWAIGLNEVTFHRKIGAGSAGTTYAAEWRGAQVAVKVAGFSGSSVDGFNAEVNALTKLRHPNIVQYLGCVVSPPTCKRKHINPDFTPLTSRLHCSRVADACSFFCLEQTASSLSSVMPATCTALCGFRLQRVSCCESLMPLALA